MKILHTLTIALALPLLAACTAEDNSVDTASHGLSLTASVDPFDGETSTRANLEGTAFEENDLIRVKVICPYVSSTEFGESTWGNSKDGFWLLYWKGSNWSSVTSAFGFDINGDYVTSAASDLQGQYLSQQTPYVFTASTWTEEKSFVVPNGSSNTLILQYANVFHADQTKAADYKASDVLWAQSIMQTGTDYVHLAFKHVMAALTLTVSGIDGLSDNAVLTVEGMPDIDQAEIVVGDKYAAKNKVSSSKYGYKNMNATTSDNENGKVLGIGINDETNGMSYSKSFTDIAQTATYKAYNNGNNTYKLVVPPCTLTSNATVWVRDGQKRYKATLEQKKFAQGTMYYLTLNFEPSTTGETTTPGETTDENKEGTTE